MKPLGQMRTESSFNASFARRKWKLMAPQPKMSQPLSLTFRKSAMDLDVGTSKL